MIASTGDRFAPAFYVMAAALVTGLVVLRSRETHRAPLEEV
jgi:MHS family proline/betaine transporter-like MFS transporter